jgi:hypothetical protein
MAVVAVEERQVEVFWVDDGTPADLKNGPGRFRGAGLVALNLQPNCEGAGALPSGQSRHPTVIHATATMGEIGGDGRVASGHLTALGLARMTVIR